MKTLIIGLLTLSISSTSFAYYNPVTNDGTSATQIINSNGTSTIILDSSDANGHGGGIIQNSDGTSSIILH